jgi:hypothetical protein
MHVRCVFWSTGCAVRSSCSNVSPQIRTSVLLCRLGPVGAVFERFGAVKAGPFTAARLLREREAVLLFPGGGREVCPVDTATLTR